MYSQEQMAEFFVNPKKYQKTGTVSARLAIAGEQIITIIDDVEETRNVAGTDDMVIRGPKGEEYILSSDKFFKRYDGPVPLYTYQEYSAVGITYAVEWQHSPATFVASWGEQMIINPNDYLCSPTIVPDGDLYRIERDTFFQTYQEAEGDENDI